MKTVRGFVVVLAVAAPALAVGCGLLGGYDFGGYKLAPDGGATGGGASSSTSSTGGGDAGTCTMPSECPQPDPVCGTATCVDGGCGVDAMPAGTVCAGGGDAKLVCVCDDEGACAGKLLWSKQYGNIQNEDAAGIALDPSGNPVIAGDFQQILTIGGAVLSIVANAPAERDTFVAKISGDTGNTLWAARFGNGGQVTATSVAVDASGNVLVAAYADMGAIVFGTETVPGTSSSNTDILLAKLTASGDLVWMKRFGDSSGVSQLLAHGPPRVAADSAGNVVLTGSIVGAVDFGNGMPTPENVSCGFVVKLTPNGTYLWSNLMSDPVLPGQNFRGVAVDGLDRILVTGAFTGDNVTPFEPGGSCGAVVTKGFSDMFVARFAGDGGGCDWFADYGAHDETQFGEAVAIGPSGELAVTGELAGQVVVDPFTVDAGDVDSIFLARPVPQANALWAKASGNGSPMYGLGVAVDGKGNVVATGNYLNQIDFGAGPLDGAANAEIYLVKLGPDGSVIWNHAFGDGTGGLGVGVATDAKNRIYAFGTFAGGADFGDGSMGSVNGSSDLYLAKFAP